MWVKYYSEFELIVLESFSVKFHSFFISSTVDLSGLGLMVILPLSWSIFETMGQGVNITCEFLRVPNHLIFQNLQ